jgi:multicomponent Na+:H+ antiporter subunit D
MSVLLVLPILIPLLCGASALLLRSSRPAQRFLGVGGAAALLASALLLIAEVERQGVIATQLGNWPAPYGITIVADRFSAVMVLLAGVIGLAVAVYSLGSIDSRREREGFYAFFNFLLMGVCGAFLTGDIFNLYVWFEVMLMASFILMALGGERLQLEGAVKYVMLNVVSSLIFLAAIGILYGAVGTLNMADLALHLGEVDQGLATAMAMLFLVAFGIKSAIFPLFFWLPASYHTPPVAVTALFAGLLTKVGVYSMIRVFTLLFTHDVPFTHSLILVLGGLTMVTGVLGAVAHEEFRRILSVHIVSQIGYMIVGLGLFTVMGLAGAIVYIAHNIVVKTNLFLVSGVAYRLGGTYELSGLKNLYRTAPWLSVLFVVSAFSLAGMPPLSGFWAKLFIVRAGLEEGAFMITGTALAVGLLTLFSMTKIWGKAFWPEGGEGKEQERRRGRRLRWRGYLYAPMVFLTLITVGMGVLVDPVFTYSLKAAHQLLDPSLYIETVLRGRP